MGLSTARRGYFITTFGGRISTFTRVGAARSLSFPVCLRGTCIVEVAWKLIIWSAALVRNLKDCPLCGDRNFGDVHWHALYVHCKDTAASCIRQCWCGLALSHCAMFDHWSEEGGLIEHFLAYQFGLNRVDPQLK